MKTTVMLNEILVEQIDLLNSIKLAHWNVRGKNFMPLHTMFEGFYGEVAANVDEVAERIAELGASVRANTQTISERTTLSAYLESESSELYHLTNLSKRFEQVISKVQLGIETLNKTTKEDKATEDLLIETLRIYDKINWKLKSHLE